MLKPKKQYLIAARSGDWQREVVTMVKKRRQHDQEAWSHAKKVCRLNARQVEMARALGMNPKKLPGLRPSPQQRWKLPVAEFIEERYWKRFGGNARNDEPREPKPGSGKPSTPRKDAHAPGAVCDPTLQAQDLICYLTNLAEGLNEWLAQGTIAAELLQQVGAELREIADALDSRATLPQVPAIPFVPREARRDAHERTFGDDIPF